MSRNRRRKPGRSSWTAGQQAGMKELQRYAKQYPNDVLKVEPATIAADGALTARILLSTHDIAHDGTHMDLKDAEEFIIGFTSSYPAYPPHIEVDHERWLGTPHMLYSPRWSENGMRACIYLDPDREWHPGLGVHGALNRLWDFLEEAATGQFNARDALFHPIGGIDPYTFGAPTAVIRDDPGTLAKPLSIASAQPRSTTRVDIGAKTTNRSLQVLTMSVPEPLYRGPGRSIHELIQRVAEANGPTVVSQLTALGRTAATNGRGTPLYIVIAVSRSAAQAGPGYHLAVAQLDQKAANALAAGAPGGEVPALAQAPGLEWLRTSDQRAGTATRRDHTRPVGSLRGLRIELWGCGALGSWIGEFLVRAGVATLTLRDLRTVGADLLVRQNYTEDDVGAAKAQQLAARLSGVSDQTEVDWSDSSALSALTDGFPQCDAVIDATVNETVAAFLNAIAASVPDHPLLASVATDVKTASLGLVAVAAPGFAGGPSAIEDTLHHAIIGDGNLEAFHAFWREPELDDELIPMRGCSTPTFHGSAADAAGLAAAMVNATATHVGTNQSGLHLINMPYSGVQTDGHTYLAYPDDVPTSKAQ